jgi:hypothetical protein
MTPAASAARSTKSQNDSKRWKTTPIAVWRETSETGGYSKVDVPFLERVGQTRQKVPRRLLMGEPKEALSKALKLPPPRRAVSPRVVRKGIGSETWFHRQPTRGAR